MQTLAILFSSVYNKIKRKAITMSDSLRAFILVQKAGISKEQERGVMYRIDFKKDDCFEEVRKSLIILVGDSRRVTKQNSNNRTPKQGRRGIQTLRQE